ncbi:kidins220 [Symbiodinium sp. CCMP2592]|nr:kidins220 [Symbiodinium sp. CCMP2592]
MPSYDLLVQNHNTCLLDIWSGECTQKNLAIFEEFPSEQGPAPDGFMLDFLGISMPMPPVAADGIPDSVIAPGRTFLWEYLKIPGEVQCFP